MEKKEDLSVFLPNGLLILVLVKNIQCSLFTHAQLNVRKFFGLGHQLNLEISALE